MFKKTFSWYVNIRGIFSFIILQTLLERTSNILGIISERKNITDLIFFSILFPPGNVNAKGIFSFIIF